MNPYSIWLWDCFFVLSERFRSRNFGNWLKQKKTNHFYSCRSLSRTEENLTNKSELDFTLRRPFKHISYLSFKEINTLVKGYAKRWASKKSVQTHFSRAISTKDMILNQIYQVQACENKEYWKNMGREEYSGPWLLMVLTEAQKPGWQGGIAIRKVFARNP